eukprot:88177-Prymnesium_polylepis.2
MCVHAANPSIEICSLHQADEGHGSSWLQLVKCQRAMNAAFCRLLCCFECEASTAASSSLRSLSTRAVAAASAARAASSSGECGECGAHGDLFGGEAALRISVAAASTSASSSCGISSTTSGRGTRAYGSHIATPT